MAEKKMFATRIDNDVLKALKHLSVDTESPIYPHSLKKPSRISLINTKRGLRNKGYSSFNAAIEIS